MNSLIFGVALPVHTPGIVTFAVRGRNNVSQKSEQVVAKAAKRLLKGSQAASEMVVS